MKRLNELDLNLKELHIDFNNQVASLSTDTKEFHTSLIDLTSRHPDHKELIQFIVLVNDKLETNQHIFGEIMVEAFNDLINSKRALVRELIDDHDQPKSTMQIIATNIKATDLKTIFISVAVIVISIGLLVDPTFGVKITNLISGWFGG